MRAREREDDSAQLCALDRGGWCCCCCGQAVCPSGAVAELVCHGYGGGGDGTGGAVGAAAGVGVEIHGVGHV